MYYLTYLIYGLSFLFLGCSILLKVPRDSRFAGARCFWGLGWFGITHGMLEWASMLGAIGDAHWTPGQLSLLSTVKLALELSSFFLLFLFGSYLLDETGEHRARNAVCFPTLLFTASFAYYASTRGFTAATREYMDPLARLTFAFAGSVLVSFGFYRIHRLNLLSEIHRLEKVERSTLGLSAVFLVYGVCAGILSPKCVSLFSSIFHSEILAKISITGVFFIRSGCAVLAAFFTSQLLSFFNWEMKERLQLNLAEVEKRLQQRTDELRKAQATALEAAHQAGMSEVATEILHNVGNVLNSVNVGLETIIGQINNSAIHGLHKANDLVRQNLNDPATFFSKNPKGGKLLHYYLDLEEAIKDELAEQRKEADEAMSKLTLIKDIIHTQQEFAVCGPKLRETLCLPEIVDCALSVQTSALTRHNIKVVRKYSPVPPVFGQRAKLVHVVLNLIKNAKEAMENEPGQRVLTVEIGDGGTGGIFVRMSDTGHGIAREKLPSIFTHGFTTKKNGHGFGLHFCANSTAEMGARISVSSKGPGKGAEFMIRFQAEEVQAA